MSAAAAAKSTTKTGILWNIVCVLVCIILIPFIICSIYLSVETRKSPNQLATVFGRAPVVVLSGSMEPVFEVNDLIFIEKVEIEDLQEKDIICFYDDGQFITHRISRIVIEEGEKRFYTMGDFNGVEDKDYVVAAQIQGRYTGRIPKLGAVILFIQDPYGLVLTLILLLLLYITGELLVELHDRKKRLKGLAAEIASLKTLLEEKELLLGKKETLIAEQANVLAERAQTLDERDVLLAAHMQQIVEKEVLLADKDRQLADKDTWIVEQEQLLVERESRIAELERRLIEQEEWIKAFQPRPDELPPIEEVEEIYQTPIESPLWEQSPIAEESLFDGQVEETLLSTEQAEEEQTVGEEVESIAEYESLAEEERAIAEEVQTVVIEEQKEVKALRPTKLRKIRQRRMKILSLHKEKPIKDDRKDTRFARFLKK